MTRLLLLVTFVVGGFGDTWVMKFGDMQSWDRQTEIELNIPPRRAAMQTWIQKANSLGGIPVLNGDRVKFEHVIHEVNDTLKLPCMDVDAMIATDAAWVTKHNISAVLMYNCDLYQWTQQVNNSLTGWRLVEWVDYMVLLTRERAKHLAGLGVTVFTFLDIGYLQRPPFNGEHGNHLWNLDVDRTTKGAVMVERVARSFKTTMGYDPKYAFVRLNEGGWYSLRVASRVDYLIRNGQGENIVYNKVLSPFTHGCLENEYQIECPPGKAGGSVDRCCNYTNIRETLKEIRDAGANVLILYVWLEGGIFQKMMKEMNINFDVFYSINGVHEVHTLDRFEDMTYVLTSKVWARDGTGEDDLYGNNEEAAALYESIAQTELTDYTARLLQVGPILTGAIRKLSSFDAVRDWQTLDDMIKWNPIEKSFLGPIRFMTFRYNAAFRTIETQQYPTQMTTVLPDSAAAAPLVLPIPTFDCRGSGSRKCNCSVGSAGNLNQDKCMPCGPGYYTIGGNETCSPCSPGQFSEGGVGSCKPCPNGTYQQFPGKDHCTDCPIGYYCGEGFQEAVPCNVGFYQDVTGQSSCKECKNGYTTKSQFSSNYSSCQCAAGKFDKRDYSMDIGCSTCPDGVECRGFKEGDVLMEGFYAEGFIVNPIQGVWQCAARDVCVGQAKAGDNPCAPSTEGLNCGKCSEGAYRTGDQTCVECGSGGSWMFFLAIPIGFLFVGAFTRPRPFNNSGNAIRAAIMIGVLLAYIQVIAMLRHIAFDWPSSFRAASNAGAVFLLDVGVVRPGCLFQEKYSTSYLMNLVVPLLFVVCAGTWFLLSRLLHSLTAGRFKAYSAPFIVNQTGVIVLALFVGIVSTTTSWLECYSSPNERTALRRFPYVECTSSEHNEMLPAFLVGLTLYVIGVLATFCYAIHVAPKNFPKESFRIMVRFMVFKFRPPMFWYSIPLMLRALAVAMVPVISPDDSYLQFYMMTFVFLIFIVMHLKFQPFTSRISNDLEFFQMLILTCILIFGSWFIDPEHRKEEPGTAAVLAVFVTGLATIGTVSVVGATAYAFLRFKVPAVAQFLPMRPMESPTKLGDKLTLLAMMVAGEDAEAVLQSIDKFDYVDRQRMNHVLDELIASLSGKENITVRLSMTSHANKWTGDVSAGVMEEAKTKAYQKLLQDTFALREAAEVGDPKTQTEEDTLAHPANGSAVVVGEGLAEVGDPKTQTEEDTLAHPANGSAVVVGEDETLV